jgi:hypothetical protein
VGHELGDAVTYLVGGSVVPIAIGMLLTIGLILTMAPVVYRRSRRSSGSRSPPSSC